MRGSQCSSLGLLCGIGSKTVSAEPEVIRIGRPCRRGVVAARLVLPPLGPGGWLSPFSGSNTLDTQRIADFVPIYQVLCSTTL